jgi:hypothetical protein
LQFRPGRYLSHGMPRRGKAGKVVCYCRGCDGVVKWVGGRTPAAHLRRDEAEDKRGASALSRQQRDRRALFAARRDNRGPIGDGGVGGGMDVVDSNSDDESVLGNDSPWWSDVSNESPDQAGAGTAADPSSTDALLLNLLFHERDASTLCLVVPFPLTYTTTLFPAADLSPWLASTSLNCLATSTSRWAASCCMAASLACSPSNTACTFGSI